MTTPERIGPYKILEPLGKGGMSLAFRAVHETLQKQVVVKLLAPQLAAIEAYRDRFLNEARMLARLSHPNVVQVFDADCTGDHWYMAMEYVQGRDLQSYLETASPLELAWFLKVIRGVVRGLQSIHEAGVVHRDIKPANILIGPDDTAKIADFGIALNSADAVRLTQTGVVVGTPLYFSPEHALDKPIDGRSDLYSLGVILYHGVAGQPPFKAETATAMIVKHAREQALALHRLAPGVPQVVNDMTMKLLAKNPAMRYQSAAALLPELDRAITLSQGHHLARPALRSARPASRESRVVTRQTRTRNSPLFAMAVVGGVLTLLVIIALLVGPPAAPSEGDTQGTPSLAVAPTSTPAPAPTSTAAPQVPTQEPTPKPPPIVEVPSDRPAQLPAQEKRRALDHCVYAINLAGLAAEYCDLRGMASEATQLRRIMTQNEDKAARLLSALKEEGQNPYVDDHLRPSDRIVWFDNQKLDRMKKADLMALLGTFVAKVTGGARARVVVQRDEETTEFVIRFDERPPELLTIMQVTGLIPGQTVKASDMHAPPSPTPRPSPDPTTGASPTAAPSPPPDKATPVESRRPVPDEASQKRSETLIRDIFKEEYARSGAAAKVALAHRLLQEAVATTDDVVGRFVLLREARDLAAQAADIDLAMRAVNELNRYHAIDMLAMRVAILSVAEKNARSSEESRRLVDSMLELAQELAGVEEFEAAERIAAGALAAAKRAKEIPLVAKADARAKEIANLKQRSDAVAKARETLRASPADGAANLAVGQWLCLVRGQWDSGLPHLERGTDAALRDLARRDRGKPSEPMDQVAVGDGWWDLVEKASGIEKENLRARAVHWYERALPRLSGLHKMRIEKRLGEQPAVRVKSSGVDPGPPGDWIDFTDPQSFGLSGRKGDPVEVKASPGSPDLKWLTGAHQGEFDAVSVRMTFDPRRDCQGSLVLERGARNFYFVTATSMFLTARFDYANRRWVAELQTRVPKRDSYVLMVAISGGAYVVFVDGEEKMQIKTSARAIDSVGLQADHAPVQFDQIRLRLKKK